MGLLQMKAQELKAAFGIDSEKPIVLFTQHSVTTEYEQAQDQVLPGLEAMRQLRAGGLADYSAAQAARRVLEREGVDAALKALQRLTARGLDEEEFRGLLPALTEMGIDVLNPIQWRCEGMEREAIVQALEQTRYNKTKAAKLLGISFRALRYRIKKFGIE